MKRLLFPVLIAAAMPAFAAVGVSVNVGEPGFYGRIDIGNAPAPQVIYAQPVVIREVRVAQAPQPLYLRVPPGHAQKWAKHCDKYDACGRPVYFVKDDWYQNVYAPHYRQSHGHPSQNGHGNGKGKSNGKGKDK